MTQSNFLQTTLERRPVILQFLKFAAIGALNTALDFIILNFITKSLNINSGLSLGILNIISFSAAIIQSYLWNKAWAFGDENTSLVRNFFRLMLVGGLGAISFILVLLGSAYGLLGNYYFLVLVVFLLSEVVLWHIFAFKFLDQQNKADSRLFIEFLAVSLIGLVINSSIVALGSRILLPSLSDKLNLDLIKNIAKMAATILSLVWNFIGYKLIVFKK